MKRLLLPALAVGALLSATLTGTGYAAPAATTPSHPASAHKPSRDSTPPQPVNDLRMTGNDTRSISLAWANPTDPDFAGVMIRRAAGDTPPVSAADGTLVATLGSRRTTFTDKHLSTASSYSYAVFPRDKSRNVGIAATLTTATRSSSTATGLRGKVTDAQGHPITAVQVEVREASTGNGVAGTATTSTGQFTVTGLAPGSYLVCFFPDSETSGPSPTGYLPGCYRQQPYGYGDTGTPVTVRAGKLTSGLVDYLPVAGAISGRVTDSTGHGIAGVSVGEYNPDDPGQISHGAITRADGTYTMTGLAAGTYQVCFSSQGASGGSSTTGYLDECYDNQPQYGTPTPVAVSLGQTTRGIDAVLATGGAITGHVTDTDGAPVPNVSAELFGGGGESTDGTGAYTITGLATGSYTLCFNGWFATSATAPYGYTDSCAGDHYRTVDVQAGQTTTAEGTVQKAGAIGGTVTGDDGPVPGVLVTAFDSSGGQLNSVSTDDNGGYLLTGMPPGEVSVCFDPTYTDGGYQRTCYGTQDGGSPTPIAVTAGQLSTADAHLAKGASITGTVTDASGAPISNVLVTAYNSTSYEGFYAQTDSAGNYTLDGLSAADYLVCFDPSNAQGPAAGGYAAQCYDDQPSMDTANPVSVGSTGSVTVNATLRAGAAITGRVTGSDGATLGAAYIYAYEPTTGQYVTASSDYFDGSYRLPGLTAGDYSICFDAVNVHQPSPTGYVNECYDDNDGTLVHVAAGSVTTGIDAELAVAAGISGRITDSAGHGLPYAGVYATGVDGSYLGANSTDDTGRYQLTGLPAATVLVCFDGPYDDSGTPRYQSRCYRNAVDSSTATPLTLTAGQFTAGIDQALPDAP